MNVVQERALERANRVAELTRQGLTTPQIQEITGLSARTIVRWRSRTGTSKKPGRPKEMTTQEHCAAFAMLTDGASIADVARTLGRSHDTIWRYYGSRFGMDRFEIAARAALGRKMAKL